MATTVDGLISGLDTTSIISQLMQINAAPQTRLKSTLTQQQSALSALQSVNTRMANLQTAAEALQKATVWGAATATSNSAAVTATAAAGALSGSTTFSVTQLATAQSMVSAGTFSSLTDTSAVTDTAFEIHRGSSTVAIQAPADGSLQSLVFAINATKDAGVRAAAVQVSPGQYRLQLTASDTGLANSFSLTGAAGAPLAGLSFTQVSAGQDAVLHVGDAATGFDITSASNTVENVMPGLTVKVTGKVNDVTVGVAQDKSAVTSAVQALVDAANSALSAINGVSANGVLGADGKRTGGGPLAGDALMRQLTSQILSKVSSGVGGKSLSTVGISVSRDGSVTFDSSKLSAALGTDPAAAKATFTTATTAGTGFADIMAGFGKDSSSSTGTIAGAITGRQSSISDLTDRISDWDVRLASRQLALQKQYSALEVALGKLKSQSTWLSGQINAMSNNGSD